MRALIGTLLAFAFVWCYSTRAEQIPLESSVWTGDTNTSPSGVKNAKRIITPELTKFVQEVVDNGTVPGLSLGVVYGEDAVEFGTWGRKTEDGDEMTTDTLFYLASCSKAFLAGSVGILMDDYAHGRNKTPLPPNLIRFDWYTKVKDILPEDWKLMDEWASEKATVRDILSHQSGLPRHDFSYTTNDTSLDVIRRMRYLRPAFELRERYHYNNQMYMLGSYLISKYSGMSYMEFVKARIWEPLNMSDTTLYESEASRDGKLTQAWIASGRRIPIWMHDEQVLLNAGPGGIMSSTIDMVKWVRMLLNAGVNPVTNTTVLSRSAFDMVTTAHIPVDGRAPWPEFSFSGYGMGWSRLSYQGHEIVTHSGGIPGFSTFVFFLPSAQLGLVALANGDGTHNQELAVIYRIIEDFLGLERKHSLRMLAEFQNRTSIQHHRNTVSLSPPLSLEDYAGIYVDPGYPNMTLCAPTSNSVECTQALEHFAHFEDIGKSQTLYAIVPSAWISHARLVHIEENRFELAGTYLFPHGYGKDQSPFETWKPGDTGLSVEFVVQESTDKRPKVVGVGLKGFVGETTMRERVGGTIEETAEVYFVKVV